MQRNRRNRRFEIEVELGETGIEVEVRCSLCGKEIQLNSSFGKKEFLARRGSQESIELENKLEKVHPWEGCVASLEASVAVRPEQTFVFPNGYIA